MPTVSIYVPQTMFDEVLKRADERGISFSKALLGGTRKVGMRVETMVEFSERLDRIESKLDQVICGFGDFPVVDRIREKTKELTTEELDELKSAQDRINTVKGPVKANAAMQNFFNPMPKGKKK